MPEIDQREIFLAMMTLSFITWWIIFFWTLFMARHEALMPIRAMMPLFIGFKASLVLSFPLVFVSKILWVYFFAVETMAMAILFGYMLAVNVRCQDLPEEEDAEA